MRSNEKKSVPCTFLGEISIHRKIVAAYEHNFPALREFRQQFFSLHNTNLRQSRNVKRDNISPYNRTTDYLTCQN